VYLDIVAGDCHHVHASDEVQCGNLSSVVAVATLFVPPKIMSMSQIKSHSPFYN